jgi:hypothetical protein
MYPRFAMSIDNPPDSGTRIPYWEYGEFKRNGAQNTRGIPLKVGSDPQAALR